jgi:RNA-directed DNA polymerase
MKADHACAPSSKTVDWNAIDWRTAHQNVRRLQVRIVKAMQEGRWGKVKALQHLLTHSFSGRVMAVRRVTENRGKRTPGIDGIVWDTPHKKSVVVQSLRQRGYHPQPLRRVYIPKSSNPKKLRPLGIPTMKDRAMQALYLLGLDPVAETTADPNSNGFRKERSLADAISQCYPILCRKVTSPQWILEGDIKACFDQISHNWLVANIPMDKAILRKWLKAGYMEKEVFHPTEAGTPQGGIASTVLANLTLDKLERELKGRFCEKSRNRPSTGVNYVRFADDFIVTARSKELLENQMRPFIEQFMNERGLMLSSEKTRITHIAEGFDFLGRNVRKYHGKLIIKPAKKNVKAHLTQIRDIIRANQTATAGTLVVRLNPIIRGWANYHRHQCSKRIYAYTDHATYKALWHWARRRHPNKGARWVKKKYFKTVGKRNWVFTGTNQDREGRQKVVHLLSAAYTPIRRHVKIRAKANPYDPQWEMYFEERLKGKMEDNLQGKKKLQNLWKTQDGRCSQCGQLITQETGWHIHHRAWRSKGGGDERSNLEMLHLTCHQQIHSQRLSVAEPCPARGI